MTVLRARNFAQKAVALQRTGRLATCASCVAQEAVGVGSAQMMPRGANRAAVPVAGDGAASKREPYDAMNLAGPLQVLALNAITNSEWTIALRPT